MTRDVSLYLPASYDTNAKRRYTVVYFLHGYAAHAETYWNSLSAATAADAVSAEMILILPNAFTIYDSSMFSNSATTGDWETFIASDLVITSTSTAGRLPIAERGLAGHSMADMIPFASV